jgi:hydroxypyruvate reductase
VTPAPDSRRALLEAILAAAIRETHAGERLRAALALEGDTLRLAGRALARDARLVVLAVGKAAGAMALALEDVAGERIAAGLAVTKAGHGTPLRRCALLEAGHPVPDARSAAAGREVLRLAEVARPDDVLVVLLSGGASSLLACPQPGLELEDLAATTALLLRAGAEIDELNAVRKHLTELSGGRLVARAGSRTVEVCVVSDVLGDRLDVIGSGPCAPDPTTFADALGVLGRRRVLARVPAAVRSHLEAGARGERSESPKPGDPVFAKVRTMLLAANRDALAAAAREAGARGLRAVVVSGSLRGEARDAGRRLAALGRALRDVGPVCLLAGGETTVTVRGPGRGGRSQELCLAAALALDGEPRVAMLAAGTDGSDGPTDAAGAFADGGSVARGARLGLDARACLARNDAHGFFAVEGGVLRTGPTGTNVLDLALVLARP